MYFTLCFVNLLIWCTAQEQNYLLIIVDDLRTALGCYGDSNAYTPNIDDLAKRSAIFLQAYAQQALCAPSRNSFLTSRRPDTLRLYDFYSYWRTDAGNFTTLPQHFKNNGYISKSIGKVFHPGISSNNSDDSPYSWTETPFHPSTEKYKDAPVCRANLRIPPAENLVCPVQVSSMPNKTLPDIEILDEAKRFLSNQSGNTKPFFLAVGFHKPHIPFKYPKKYLKYHPLRKFKVPRPYKWSEDVSSVAYNPWNDLRKRKDVEALNLKFPWEKIPKSFARLIIRSYYASVTYIDDLIGQLMNQLKLSSLTRNTTVILTSDHGWSLGERAVWAKYSNYDVTLRVPLIMSIPGLTFERNEENKRAEIANYDTFRSSKNRMIINSLVELVDVFPTIADLANRSIPVCSNENTRGITNTKRSNSRVEIICSEGVTLVPLIRAASKQKSVLWKKAVFGQYPRPSVEPSVRPNSDEPRSKQIVAMGYTLRTDRYRYTCWVRFSAETSLPDWKDEIAEELYDHNIDEGETRNVADSRTYAEVKDELRTVLRRGWRYALPGTFIK